MSVINAVWSSQHVYSLILGQTGHREIQTGYALDFFIVKVGKHWDGLPAEVADVQKAFGQHPH